MKIPILVGMGRGEIVILPMKLGRKQLLLPKTFQFDSLFLYWKPYTTNVSETKKNQVLYSIFEAKLKYMEANTSQFIRPKSSTI